MAFWGIEVQPGKPFTHSFDKARGRLHISQATLGIIDSPTKTERSVLQCKVGDKSRPIFLCSLISSQNESSTLDIEFDEEDDIVVFEVLGSLNVHLTGFYVGNNIGKKVEVKPCQIRTLANGLVIEDIEMGNPNSRIATLRTNKVSVHYIGKLQSNGLVFEATVGTTPLEFAPGDGKLIKGFETGINGMRVGGKRRLTIPPSVGYGSGGAKGVQPDSWLDVEVEVVNIS